jgi:hypothetical protein
MNVLSLRINAVKSDENVRKTSIELIEFEIESSWYSEGEFRLILVARTRHQLTFSTIQSTDNNLKQLKLHHHLKFRSRS